MQSFDDVFSALVADLARTPAPPDSANPYADDEPGGRVRQANLLLYLRHVAMRNPPALLVAEAPGYRGTRLTGVPFSSRTLLLDGVPEVGMFGAANGYAMPPDAENAARREATATIVWETLVDLQVVPIVWNSFPFHPHQPGQPQSNRPPRRGEVELGRGFLMRMLELFPVQVVVAVGNTAADTLTWLEIPHEKVRHPSQGGKRDFITGMRRILGPFSPAVRDTDYPDR